MPKSPARGRMADTWRSLVIMVAIGAVLAGYHAYGNRTQVALATGPATEKQLQFLIDLAERPDAQKFFSDLSPAQRILVANRIAEHDHPKMPELALKLIETFDPEARQALGTALVALTKGQLDEVAKGLRHGGSFQRTAVHRALEGVGPQGIEAAARRLREPEAAPGAVSFLISQGEAAIPVVLKELSSSDEPTRLAAAEALGKLRAHQAAPVLTRLFHDSEGAAKVAYFNALAELGYEPTFDILVAVLRQNPQIGMRSQAALGLGRIGTPQATRVLWDEYRTASAELRPALISGLQLAGDAALLNPTDERAAVTVAEGIRTPASSAFLGRILEGERDPELLTRTISASEHRESLVPQLVSLAASLDPESSGSLADAAIRALTTTEPGLQALRSGKLQRFDGLVQRRLTTGGRSAE